eukprot:7473447-Lingulodinium_polyedra.AAC.1
MFVATAPSLGIFTWETDRRTCLLAFGKLRGIAAQSLHSSDAQTRKIHDAGGRAIWQRALG